jgi:hypothetical protein
VGAAHDVGEGEVRSSFVVARAKRFDDRTVLVGRFLERANDFRAVGHRLPQHPHQRQQYRAPGGLVDREVEIPVERPVSLVLVAEFDDPGVDLLDRLELVLGDPLARELRCEGLERGNVSTADNSGA